MKSIQSRSGINNDLSPLFGRLRGSAWHNFAKESAIDCGGEDVKISVIDCGENESVM